MRVRVPPNEKWLKPFTSFQNIYRIVERTGEYIEIDCPFGIEIDRLACNMGKKEFARFFRAIQVVGGKKVKRGDILTIDPYKSRKVVIRYAPEELEYVKKAAEAVGMSLSEYIRSAVFMRMLKDLGIE